MGARAAAAACSGSMVAGRCHKATPQPNTSGAMSTNMSCTWARGPRSSFTACQPAIGRYLGRESTTSQSRSATRPWRQRINLVPRTLTAPTAPNKLLPSGLKLHQKNGGMEARRCHNSATVGAPPRLPTELFVRVFQPGLRMRWSSSMATTELGATGVFAVGR